MNSRTPDTDELIRDDVLRWRVEQLKGEAQNDRTEISARVTSEAHNNQKP